VPSSKSRLPLKTPSAQPNSREPAATESSDNSRLVDRTRKKQTYVTATLTRTKSTATQSSTTKSSVERQHVAQGDGRYDTLEADSIEGGPLTRNRNHTNLPGTARRLIPDSEDEETFGDESSAIHDPGLAFSGRTDPGLIPAHLESDQELGPRAASATLSQLTYRHRCTRKHFRIKRIIGRETIDNDAWYDVRWKPSWVPSHLIVRSEDGRDFIEIDGKDWYIKEILKAKIKKGIRKQLVRWTDDTQEPLLHLGKALGAVEAFEQTPKLKRDVITFDESLLDQRTILPQSEDDFREAQIHLAKNWPITEPRNDIDLLPALKQIILEDPEHPRNDKLRHRKTHFTLLDQRQVRHLRWNEAYILSGRLYDCTLPRRNAILLQVVGETEGKYICCERCMSPTSPFAECVRDASDDDPWFNGGCANCGAFEANTTCIHHNVGREDEEGRSQYPRCVGFEMFLLILRIGITVRVPKGSSRESRAALNRSNLGLRESLLRLKYLDYDNGTDSETYSADSYNSSDESADSASEIDAQDDESEALFCTPSPRPINLFTGSAHAAQDSPVFTSAQFIAERESIPARDKRPGALRRVKMGRPNPRLEVTTEPKTPHNAGSGARVNNPPSVRKNAANGRGPFSHYDRSSTVSTPRTEEDRLPTGSDDSQYFGGGDDFWDDMGLMNENFGPAKDGQPPRAGVSKSGCLAAKSNLSPASESSAATSRPVFKSIETDERRSAMAQVNNTPSADGSRSPVSTVSKKRASSQPPMHERPSRRSLTSNSFDSMYSLTPDVAERTRPEQLHASHNSGRVKQEECKREFTHPGCVAHRPCTSPANFTVRSGRPLVAVYKNDVDDSRPMTLGQAEFIISHCTCHWANGFTEVWADAQGKFGNLAKAEVLLAYFQDNLWRAARECCPSRPGHVECIVIDD
jgi:hypothetical protein